MNWYYVDNGKVVGPLTEATMIELQACGMLTDVTQVTKEGTEDWVNYADAFKDVVIPPLVSPKQKGASFSVNAWTKVADGVSSAAGLEKLEGSSAKGLMGQLFQKRTIDDMDESFAIGTTLTTPELAKVSAEWPAPWVFLRLLTFTVIVTIGFYWAIQRFENIKLYPGWLFMGAFAVPFSVMFFFIETNVLRNVSFYRVLKLVFFGGLLSLIFALFLFEATAAAKWFGAMAAGPVEELAKILAVVFFARHWKNFHWQLNGLLLGAAVGAGFAAFETAGYIFEHMITGGSDTIVMILRALTAPFTHIIWTAATVGALWRFKGERDFTFGMLKEWPVLRVVVFVMLLHALWNSPLYVPFVGDFLGMVLKWLILGAVGWILVLLLIQSGLAQVKKAKQSASLVNRQSAKS